MPKRTVHRTHLPACGKHLLFPCGGVIVLADLISAAALVWVFTRREHTTPLAYAAYLLSAYALVVSLAAVPPLYKAIRCRLYGFPLFARYMQDVGFRVRTGLGLSFLINLCYAGFRLLSAIWYASFWDGALALYYLLLCAVRLYLLHEMPREQATDARRELLAYRKTACFLLALILPMDGISVQIVRLGQGYSYSGTLIYAAAVYTFYCFGLAVRQKLKFRRFHSPVLSEAKAVSLTTAMVSVFSLETAMLAAFCKDTPFRLYMTTATACAVCAAAWLQATGMLIRVHKRLRCLPADAGVEGEKK